jgi:hypothetical protein
MNQLSTRKLAARLEKQPLIRKEKFQEIMKLFFQKTWDN